MKILFVCSSNVCRSPYAEFVFRRLVKSSPVLSAAGVEVSSSAVFNRSKVIFPKAAVSLKREGFSEGEIAAFKPSFKCSAKEKFRDADVIIGMSKMHKWLTSQEEYDKVMSVIKVYLEKYAAGLEEKLKPSL